MKAPNESNRPRRPNPAFKVNAYLVGYKLKKEIEKRVNGYKKHSKSLDYRNYVKL